MNRDFSLLSGSQFDAVICGGGIYGAWCAYDAALRGLKVAVVDQGDWAGATSSASSKLIHGGLRYLEQFDFRLVRKALKERQMLLEAAPHRIWPLRFGIPVYWDSRLGSCRLKTGLLIYDLLAGTLCSERAHRHDSATAFLQRFPCLSATRLDSGFRYLDAQTDDARLVLELIAGAQSAGAVCLNYCKVTEVIEQQGHISRIKVHDTVSLKEVIVSTRHLINTAGPWLAATDACRLAKGVHLVLPRLLEDEALLLTARSDGRVFFIIPWYGQTLIGTTDTDYTGNVEQVVVEAQDIEYLLSEANHALDSVHWTKRDIIACFAGLRVLKPYARGAPSAVSRDWELKIAGNGLFTSIGGKITSARADAAIIVDNLCARSGHGKPCQTYARRFPWAPETDYAQWTAYNQHQAHALGINAECASWLLRRFGTGIGRIFDMVSDEPGLAKPIIPGLPFIKAELQYCAENEMVVHLDDLLRRRIPLLILTKLAPQPLRQFGEIAARVLNWDKATVQNEVDRCMQL